MKNIFKRLLLLGALLPVTFACDKDFGEFNLNPNAVTSVEPALLFSDAQVRSASWNPEQMTNYCHAFMQYGWNDFWSGTNYVLSDGISSRPWNNYYTQVAKNLEFVVAQLQSKPELVNTYAASRIWRVFIYQKLTDNYGDIPYTEAAKISFAVGSTFAPEYDSQQAIYTDFIKELRASRDLLNASNKAVTGDQFYPSSTANVSVAKWKKLANSLLLRIGMRLIKVDPAQASVLVKEAVNGGVMTSNDDMPVIKYNNSLANGFYENLGDQHFLLHSTLVDHMLDSGDPRLAIYGGVYTKKQDNSALVSLPVTEFSKYDYSFDSEDILTQPQLTRIRYDIFRNRDLPFFHFPYAQVEFLLAEAVLRGYITGSAADHYNKGITAHMKMFDLIPSNPNKIADAQINTYLENNPLTGSTEEQIEQVNTEFWVSGFLFQADEVWANWRRTGYPKLVVNPNSLAGGSNSPGRIPRKMPYPESEFGLNTASLTKALSNYNGMNDFNTKARVWWDKE